MSSKDQLTVKELSTLANVSIKTLYHYDKIGLLKPARSKTNGYRLYNSKDAALLSQIVSYRALGMSLSEIKTLVLDTEFNLLNALEKQRTLLLEQQQDIDRKLKRIEVAMKLAKGEANLEKLLGSFPSESVNKWTEELKSD